MAQAQALPRPGSAAGVRGVGIGSSLGPRTSARDGDDDDADDATDITDTDTTDATSQGSLTSVD